MVFSLFLEWVPTILLIRKWALVGPVKGFIALKNETQVHKGEGQLEIHRQKLQTEKLSEEHNILFVSLNIRYEVVNAAYLSLLLAIE